MSEETPGAFPDFKTEYTGLRPILEKFELELRHQLDELLAQESVSLAVPVQSRVKDWDSIEEKLVRKPRDWGSIRDLPDLVGLRAILLFNRDVEKLRSVLVRLCPYQAANANVSVTCWKAARGISTMSR